MLSSGAPPLRSGRPAGGLAHRPGPLRQSMLMPLHTDARQSGAPSEFDINPLYVRLAHEPVPRHALPRHQMLPDTALQVVRDELLLDGNARLNLATFVTTWMEPQARLDCTDLKYPGAECREAEYPGAEYPGAHWPRGWPGCCTR